MTSSNKLEKTSQQLQKTTWSISTITSTAIDLHKSRNLIKYCDDEGALKTLLAGKLFQAIALYSKEIHRDSCILMTEIIVEDCQFDPVELPLKVIKDIARGARKIYGQVTPHDLNEMLEEERLKISLDREADHYQNKGHGVESVRFKDDRTEPEQAKKWLKAGAKKIDEKNNKKT